jgi:hypothetical protein
MRTSIVSGRVAPRHVVTPVDTTRSRYGSGLTETQQVYIALACIDCVSFDTFHAANVIYRFETGPYTLLPLIRVVREETVTLPSIDRLNEIYSFLSLCKARLNLYKNLGWNLLT